MKCIKCGSLIDENLYRSEKYCSIKCSRLWLKSQYKKRTRDRQNAYQREYRRAKNGGNRPHTKSWKIREGECLRCGCKEDLQLAHIKPTRIGGTHKHVITFCRSCHYEYDELLREYWQKYAPTSSTPVPKESFERPALLAAKRLLQG